MNKNKIAEFLSIIFVFLLVGCKAAPLYNIHAAPTSASSNTSSEQIKQAILKAARKAGWAAKPSRPGIILAAYSAKRNKFSAVVAIHYNRQSYDIVYKSSRNLKYKKVQHKAAGPGNFFIENNPFKSDEPEESYQSQSDATIHKVYNQWIALLQEKIDLELGLISPAKSLAKKYSQRNTNNKAECDDIPLTELSGSASSRDASVNLRSGASTRCKIVGSVSQADTFKLLGKKGNWYFIALDRGDQAWIYAPLVKRIVEQQKADALISPASPTAPLIPSKKISIAVIRFKTLNKEAQEIALGELVSETITSALVNSRSFKIIEREQLDKVVKEIEMNQTGFIETTDAVEIGKMLHADAIITGSVALLAGQIQLNARIIEIESAYVISAESKTTQYTLQNINYIANQIVARLSQKLINAQH